MVNDCSDINKAFGWKMLIPGIIQFSKGILQPYITQDLEILMFAVKRVNEDKRVMLGLQCNSTANGCRHTSEIPDRPIWFSNLEKSSMAIGVNSSQIFQKGGTTHSFNEDGLSDLVSSKRYPCNSD